MKAISVLGTSSNSGKSWLATALCAWVRARGLRVAPFKAQNMSNNSFATLEGGEIGRAQAVQAEACGLRPVAEMNPVLLKPSGETGSQVIVRGLVREPLQARDYFSRIDEFWQEAKAVLQEWAPQWEVLVCEGAGSPVELNLMERDIANLRPVEFLDGRWILCADIERGGVFAQIVGTWQLLPEAMRKRCLGIVVNKFRGDVSLFADAARHLAGHVSAPLLGTLPYRADLQPEPEDSLALECETGDPEGETIAWIRFPRCSNSSDASAWAHDRGVKVRWVEHPSQLAGARAIVLPGSKNTIEDLRWLKRTGLFAEVLKLHRVGRIQIVGICGGYQMLGAYVEQEPGLSLLPVATRFNPVKRVAAVAATWADGESWPAYEIHMGETTGNVPPLLRADGQPEGAIADRVWGTYLHGLFDGAAVRCELARLAGIDTHKPSLKSWLSHKSALYSAMAAHIEEHLNLDPVLRYVGS